MTQGWGVDPLGMGDTFRTVARRVAQHPCAVGRAAVRFQGGLVRGAFTAVGRVLNHEEEAAPTGSGRDARFADPAWRTNPIFVMLLAIYTSTCQLLDDLVEIAQLDAATEMKARFTVGLVNDALAPTNVLATNPAALRRAFDSNGTSVVRGAANLVHDVVHNGGWPRQVDRSAFVVGRDLAVTPGRVVFRNELVEVLQYEPRTPTVHEVPLVVIPPWINRYYIADLSPGRSLVEWARDHGHTVFAVSYRNPDASIRDLTVDDYLRLGLMTAVDVARERSGSPQVNSLGICLGGTLQALMLAYFEAAGDDLVRSATFLNSALDSVDGGVLKSVFADRSMIDVLDRQVASGGVIDAEAMAHVFDLLRANDLVFRYVVDGWLMGKPPPAFDLLAWNADSTRLPGRAHASMLRSLYIDNALTTDPLRVLDDDVSLAKVGVDNYFVAAVEDHIVPWRTSYASAQLLGGSRRFVLSSAGHIAGIVNPPTPKSRLWCNEAMPASADEWLGGATEYQDTWWNDWIAWLGARAGAQVDPPWSAGDDGESLGEAPGRYVLSN
jgi:polyhydroxyalkanoate synthase